MTSTDRVTLSPEDRKALKGSLAEMTNCLSRIEGEKEQMKDIAKAAEEKFKIKKTLINKLARTMFKHDYSTIQAENEHFEYLYESIAEGKKPTVE